MSHSHACFRPGLLRAFALLSLTTAISIAGCTETPVEQTAIAEPSTAMGAPDTDVWLLELTHEAGALRANSPRNISQRPGYDNQPSFTPEGKLMFVQMNGDRTDIWRWDPKAERLHRVTATPKQGEYSPTPIPQSESGISYIRSPDDTSGRLWRIPHEGAAPEIVFADLGPVGYHAWFDSEHVALWRLQDPSLLQLVELKSQATKTIATAVGRSPQSVPDRRAVSYTRLNDGGTWVEMYDLDLGSTEAVTLLPEGGDFHAWTPDGVLLSSVGSKVHARHDGVWQEIVDLTHLGITLSRLAVSPDGTKLALVGETAPRKPL